MTQLQKCIQEEVYTGDDAFCTERVKFKEQSTKKHTANGFTYIYKHNNHKCSVLFCSKTNIVASHKEKSLVYDVPKFSA